jgi:hypothetical protein
MICQSNNSCGVMPMVDQGSWVLSAPAEKVALSVFRCSNGAQLAQPPNLRKIRLDGQNACRYWLRQPPNLANQHAHVHPPAHARIRVRQSLTTLQSNQQTGWKGREVGKPLLHKGFSRPTCFPTFSRLGYFTEAEVVKMSTPNLREDMPTVTSIIDDFRDVFGTAYINSIIRAGMHGRPVFYASENGHTIGTPIPPGALRANMHGQPLFYASENGQAIGNPIPPDALPAVHEETHRERHYRQARARSIALTTGRDVVQTSAPGQGRAA